MFTHSHRRLGRDDRARLLPDAGERAHGGERHVRFFGAIGALQRKARHSASVTKGARVEQLDSLLRAAEAAIRSTSISLDYAIDRAIVMNRGGGKPTNAVLATVRAVEGEKKLGPPTAHLEHMRKLCGI